LKSLSLSSPPVFSAEIDTAQLHNKVSLFLWREDRKNILVAIQSQELALVRKVKSNVEYTVRCNITAVA